MGEAVRPLAELTEKDRDLAWSRWLVIASTVEEDVPLTRAAARAGVPISTARRWLKRYRQDGLSGLARKVRSDHGRRRTRPELVAMVEALALRRPRLTAASINRRIQQNAREHGWPAPAYSTIAGIIAAIDPALMTLAQDGSAALRGRYELVYRREAERPNEIWQADHTELDILILGTDGSPARPWLTLILDDHSRAVAGYTVFLGAPSALNLSLALRQAIWRKADAAWPVHGLPDALHVDHGSDFTSRHIEQVCADLHVRLLHSAIARPQGRGKVERLFGTITTELLPSLPGHLVRGAPAAPPSLTIAQLDQAIRDWVLGTYHLRVHRETRVSPHARWSGGGWLPRMPETLQALDLLLVMVAVPRVVHRDGIHFSSLRYLDPILAEHVGRSVTIRYDPRDISEIRVFLNNRFLCRVISPQHADQTITLKDIQAARTRRRRELREQLNRRRSLVDATAHARPRHRGRDPGNPSGAVSAVGGHGAKDLRAGVMVADPLQPVANPDSTGRETPEFLVTKEHRRFVEFADTCRRERYIGLCYGQPGVGKTLSARQHTHWHTIEPALHDAYWTATDHSDRGPAELSESRSVLWTPTVTVTAKQIDQQLPWLCRRFSMLVDRYLDSAGSRPLRYTREAWAVELLIVDEADRLKTTGLEQLRDFFDRHPIGLILIGMPGLEERLARYPQLYSRIGFAHHYRTLTADELRFVLTHHWEKLSLQLSVDDFTDAEAVATVARITAGNFRLVHRFFAQIERILKINDLNTITREVVEAARETLLIGAE